MSQLRKMVYGDQGITMNFMNCIMNQIDSWATFLECRSRTLAGS
jgi:hypothetical protein